MTAISGSMTPSYILEAPIILKDARRRRLPRDICKLIVAFEESIKERENAALGFFCTILSILRDDDKKVYAQPVGSYYHLDKYEAELKNKGIRYWFDREHDEGKKKKPALLTIECNNEDRIKSAFSLFEADAMVFFIAKEYCSGGQLEKRLSKRQFGHGYEEYYLKEIDTYGLFIFFENTRLSLEMLGRRGEILKAFSTAMEVEKKLL